MQKIKKCLNINRFFSENYTINQSKNFFKYQNIFANPWIPVQNDAKSLINKQEVNNVYYYYYTIFDNPSHHIPTGWHTDAINGISVAR